MGRHLDRLSSQATRIYLEAEGTRYISDLLASKATTRNSHAHVSSIHLERLTQPNIKSYTEPRYKTVQKHALAHIQTTSKSYSKPEQE
jgi:hypothetical protein